MMQKKKESRLNEYQKPLWADMTRWILGLPRLVRVVGVGVIALAITLSFSPLVDYVYLSYLFTEESRVLPSLVSAAIAVAAYVLGWWLIIGVVGEPRPVRRLVLLYVIAGIVALIFVLVLTVTGYSMAVEPT